LNGLERDIYTDVLEEMDKKYIAINRKEKIGEWYKKTVRGQ